jgi:SWI/SNF-related matrix-associated actin-dependent regulator 1 of chromatin subfamily A
MSNIIVEKEDRFLIQFDYSQRISRAVIRIPEVEFNHKYRRWECPVRNASEVFSFGAKYGFILPEKKSKRRVFDEPAGELPELKAEIELKMSLFPYQCNGVAYALEKGSCIMGDAPGLGKTAQAIAAVTARDLFPCLVICPASLKYNWLLEWKLWTDRHDPAILTDTIKNTWSVFHQMGMHDVFITNYESLKKYFVVKIDTPKNGRARLEHIRFHPNIKLFKSVIIDESHKAKDPSTMQSKLCYGLTREKELVLLLTGTPIVNRPVDLLSQILMTGKMNHFGTITNFREMCADEERWPEINAILRENCYFRREKKAVLKDLPDKYRQKIYCDIDNRQEYGAALADLAAYLAEYRQATDDQIKRSMRGEIIVRIGTLKNIAARGKLNDVIEYIDNIIEQGEKIVVFIYLKEIAAKLKEHYPDALFFTGAQNEDERNAAVNDFQKCERCGIRFERHGGCEHDFVPSPSRIIFVNYKAGGVGITLTASSTVLFIELPWHPADVEQAESRCHRISQENAVQVSFFIGRNTIDEQIMQIIEDKREMSEACTGAEDDTEEKIIHSIMDLIKTA